MILFPAKSVAARRAVFIDLAKWGTLTRATLGTRIAAEIATALG